ncbi:alpha/beta hydrolase [Colwellia sp. D2M02]|uniref:alpha/beta fold hydrolase n=1 Tax=Colwellia sp. D2M02 TaxID=2841562 RepID=UPI001C0898F6|nr:alpha/beta hydrolase [Colwellia sp. D2M02]MBU2891953.1 alpha/beta hydrolase [Colwellia sp. D2M02]
MTSLNNTTPVVTPLVKPIIAPIAYQLNALTLAGLTCVNKSSPNNNVTHSNDNHANANHSNERIVLCLHGWLDNAASFLPLLEALNKTDLLNTKVIAIDWPGHGLSEHRSPGAHYHFFDYVYDLLELLEINQWQKVDVVGHSMGGMIASAFAAAFPEKVRTLTLIDALGFICEDESQATQQLRKGMQARLKNKQAQQRNPIRYFPLSTAVKARLLVSDLTENNATLLVKRGLLETEQGMCWRSDSRLRILSPYRLTLGQAQQMMQDIQCPVKLIYADRGLKMVQEHLATATQLIANFSVTELHGGHHIHMENPSEVTKILNEFWSVQH